MTINDLEPYIENAQAGAIEEDYSNITTREAEFDKDNPLNIKIVLRAEKDGRWYDLDIVVSEKTNEILEFHPNIIPMI